MMARQSFGRFFSNFSKREIFGSFTQNISHRQTFKSGSLLNVKSLTTAPSLFQKSAEEARSIDLGVDGVSFSDFSLNSKLLERLTELSYDRPFEIQSKTLEHTLEGRDLIGRAVTGSGKTLAFALPIVHILAESQRTRNPRAIVISPTRELCMQIYREIQKLDRRVKCEALYGGSSMNRQISSLRRGVDVIIGTPGRLNDHFEQGNFVLDDLKFLCLDEGDMLLNPNFMDQIQNILYGAPESRQTMMFSATLSSDVRQLVKQHMKNPLLVDIVNEQKSFAPESVDHEAIMCRPMEMITVVKTLINMHQPRKCILFSNTKIESRKTAVMLQRDGYDAEPLNSDCSQNLREKIMEDFRSGDVQVLCATDVASRGLDVPEVDLIIMIDPPNSGSEFYLHRSGRTGRAGQYGRSYILYNNSPQHKRIIREIREVVRLKDGTIPRDDNLVEAALQRAIERLNKVDSNERKLAMETASKLDMSGSQGVELMASALAIISNISQAGLNTQPGSDSTFSTDRKQGDYSGYGTGRSRTGSYRSSRPSNHRYRDSRPSHGNSSFEDWSEPNYGGFQSKRSHYKAPKRNQSRSSGYDDYDFDDDNLSFTK